MFIIARPHLELSQWILVIVTGLVYVIVWQEYVYMAVLFSWMPGVKDAIFPFALGTAEVALVSSIPSGVTAWLRPMVAVMVLAVLILANTHWRVYRDRELNKPQRMVLDQYPKWKGLTGALAAAILALTVAAVLASLSDRLDDTAAGRTSLAVIAAATAAAYGIRLVFYVPNLRKLAKPSPDTTTGARD